MAVESPIDALSCHTLFAGQSSGVAVVSCGGSYISDDLMFQAYDRKQRFVVALDNDDAGENGWQKACDPGLNASPIPVRKEDLGRIINTIAQGQGL